MGIGLSFSGIAIGNAHHGNFSWAGWAPHSHGLPLAGLDQRSGHGGDPADALGRQMGFVDPHDSDRLPIAVFIFNRYLCAKEI